MTSEWQTYINLSTGETQLANYHPVDFLPLVDVSKEDLVKALRVSHGWREGLDEPPPAPVDFEDHGTFLFVLSGNLEVANIERLESTYDVVYGESDQFCQSFPSLNAAQEFCRRHIQYLIDGKEVPK